LSDIPELHYRPLERDDITRLPEIDRSEKVDQRYVVHDHQLVLLNEGFTHPGWDQAYYDVRLPRLYTSYDSDGSGWAILIDDRLVGISVLDGRRIGRAGDTLDLTFFHVSRELRGQGAGRKLWDLSLNLTRSQGAKNLYVSSSESRNTVDFYLARGMNLTTAPDPALFEMSPTDIHLEMPL
jgi:GNAT superfamily N-acetyltransferase